MATINLQIELPALRALMNQDATFAPITPRQVVALNALISRGLEDAGNRIRVLRELTGIARLTSSRQITLHTASVIIDAIKEDGDESWELSDYGQELIGALEERVEERAMER